MMEQMSISYPNGTLELEVSAAGVSAGDYIGFAARSNAKRAFLFMSKVLGKHYPVRPSRMHAVHEQLASQLDISGGPVVFLGMAETATGLGQGVYEAWMTMNPGQPAMYIHTTRYRVPDAERVIFEEAHSHAPNVFLNLPTDPVLRSLYDRAPSVVLVDDELSTGNTFINLVEVLRKIMPQLASLHIATIADFMGDDCRHGLAGKMKLPCSVHALLRGQWRYCGEVAPTLAGTAQHSLGREVSLQDSGYGRLGRNCPVVVAQSLIGSLADRFRHGKMLVLGTGEFMHGAFVLWLALEQQGCDVYVQATTRSPILEWGAITAKMSVPDAYGESIANYLYNVSPGQYEHILVCHELWASGAVQLGHAIQGSLIQFGKEDHVQENPLH